MTHLLLIGGSDAGISVGVMCENFIQGLLVQNCLAHRLVYNLFAAQSCP